MFCVYIIELNYEDHRTSILYQLVSELPNANRDTLAFLLLHLHKCEHLPTSRHQLVVFCITVVVIDTWRSHVTFLSYLLILYSFRVMKSPQCQMNQNNLACIFGPTVVGHGMSEPSPTTIMRDTNTQPKVCVFFNGAFYSELWGDIPRWPRYTGSIS